MTKNEDAMKKYTFIQYQTTAYKVDPVFKSKDYMLFGQPSGLERNPDLFHVSYKGKTYQYCLNRPNDFIGDEDKLLKIKRYLLVHDEHKYFLDEPNTFFIGDVAYGAEISDGFTNQKILLVDFDTIENWYPKRLEDIYKIIIQNVLINQKYLGQMNHFNSIDEDILFVDSSLSDNEKRDYRKYLQDSMARDGYISIINNGTYFDLFVLTSKAISLVEDSKTNINKIAFIAIKFGDNSERIDSICKAITEAGFEPRIMNRMETNNWIMPEIFYQIENSRFVVADFSLPCDGAYYEAGYAAALKKPVIHLFDKREERDDNKLHFDIAQKSTIFYDDYDDLKQRLISRIKATIR